MAEEATLLQIGVIARPHGIRGELKVHLHHEEGESLWQVESLILESAAGKRRSYVIESVRGTPKGPILALEAVQTREAAEELRGALVWVERSQLPALGEGEYYLADLIGAQVYLAEQLLGQVVQVRPDPSVDTLVLEKVGGGKAELPLLDHWIETVDVQKKRIELLSDDGLIQ